MKINTLLSVALLFSMTAACNKAGLSGSEKSKDLKETAPAAVDPAPAQQPVQVQAPISTTNTTNATGTTGSTMARAQTLVVTLPASTIKAGGEKIKATASFKESTDAPVVTWTLKAPTGITNLGSIDGTGVYTSPATVMTGFTVTIVATLLSDPKVSASVDLKIIPNAQVFAACTKGSETFPIFAEVYTIPSTLKRLPVYTNPSEATKKLNVCMDKYAVEPRAFKEGFPEVPSIFEYFSLKTKTTLVITTPGSYTFQLNSDDGARLYIDSIERISHDGEHQAFGPNDSSNAALLKEATFNLTAGDHPLELNYFQGPKERIALVLKWKKPGSSTFEYVPRSAFK